ncbi:TonB-dependent receptor [Moraxella macacae 0408225]|uniref:TonB-dependent receptor n=1 Tax=Moraxella macacae 0408225 TaxID=1230338 RepID=L2F7R8_9GAMM|nr:TonB-dependent receptor [Moraxella macacae]ELA08513.1 TonB-dependent receptor [Moraxella macacae 0408225]
MSIRAKKPPYFAVKLPSLSTLSLAVLLSQASFAQSTIDTNLPTVMLDTIVISASRTEKGVKEAPIPVTVISKKQLEQHQARTLKQALELLPQVQLRPLHGKTGYEVVMQGLDGNQVLVLIDGLPITASTGSTVNLNQYLNADVEQIEVIQGASSAQYGSSAMGGVINVITKRLTPNDNRITGRIAADVGTNFAQNPSGNSLDDNYRLIEASSDIAFDKQGEWLARISASKLDDKGLSLDNKQWGRLKDNSQQTQAVAKLQYAPKATNLQNIWLEVGDYKEVDIGRFNRSRGPQTYPNLRKEEIDKRRFSAGFSHQFNELTGGLKNSKLQGTKLQGSLLSENYDSFANTSVLGTTTIERNAKITTQLGQLQLDLPATQLVNQTHLPQFGVSYRKDGLRQTNNGKSELKGDDVSRNVQEIYAQDDWLIGDNLEVLAGARYQYDSDFGNHVAPKVSLKYDYVGDTGVRHIWRASVGSGYRVPDLKERYYLFDHSTYGYKVLGNPALTPETSTSYQIGYQSDLQPNLSLAVNLFYNDIKDLIQVDSTKPSHYEGDVMVFQYENVAGAKTYGGDVAIGWQPWQNLDLQINYGYLGTLNKLKNTPLTNRPKHKAGLTANYDVSDALRWINKLTYEDKHLLSTSDNSYSPAWWIWNTGLDYQVNKQLGVHTSVNNVLNKQRDVKDKNDQSNIDNRQWLIGASYQF